MRVYKLFGLSVRCDVPLFVPEYELSSGHVDVTVRCSNQKPSVSYENNKDNLIFEVTDIAQFQVQAGCQITYIPYDSATEDSLRLCIMGSCMGALLQQRGLIVLHGNAITWDNQTCSIYVGDKGAGKSTTAGWYYKQGASIVADDICAITFNAEGRPVVLPSFPQIKLWQASADLLGISTEHLKRVRVQYDKFMLPIASHQFAKEPCEVKDIFEINQHIETQQCLVGLDKLLKLQQHGYRHYFLAWMGLEYDYSKELMRLANQVNGSTVPRIICEEAHVES
ncbi:MAG: hypothetical protein K0U37_01580 [Gammaproteobacteria bacterium]|nr:hypothetical protein [Gammaproteobacteria bacterium]